MDPLGNPVTTCPIQKVSGVYQEDKPGLAVTQCGSRPGPEDTVINCC